MKKALLALCALAFIGASAETFEKGTAYAYPFGPDFHYFNNDEAKAELNTNWPSDMMQNACSFGTADQEPYGTAALWFNSTGHRPVTVADADAICPVVPDPWTSGDYDLLMHAKDWWGYGNFNFALPATGELCRVRAIFRCDTEGASDARKDNMNGILFRITDSMVAGGDDAYPGPNAKVEIPDIWENPGLYRVVDLYTDQLDGQPYLAITFMPGGFSCATAEIPQPAFYLKEVSIVPVKLLAGDNHVAGDQVVTAVAECPDLTVIAEGKAEDVDKNKLVAGTADAPNYYVLKAGRGIPYLAYSADAIDGGSGVETHLHRTNDLSAANIWAVTPGEAEGTLHIAAYESTRGLMDFVSADGVSYQMGALATVANVQDIYPVYNEDGTVSLSVINARGYDVVSEDGVNVTYFYTLDATGGSSEFCGNYIPNTNGTNWSAFKLDLTNGVDAALGAVEGDVLAAEVKAMVDQYVASFQGYIDNVPAVAAELQEGIDALKSVEPTQDYATEIQNIWSEYTSKASAALNTIYAGKDVAFKNLRRADVDKTSYISVDAEAHVFPMTETYIDYPAAVFTLETADEGYYLYNSTSQIYFGYDSNNITTVTDKENAQAIKLMLNSNGGFTGVSVLLSGVGGQNALNADQNESTNLVLWYAADAGSIWSIDAVEDAEVEVSGVYFNGIVGNVGESVEVSAVIEPAGAADADISWSSSNPTVAAVDDQGVVKFNAAGSAVVTAACSGFEFTVPFSVKEVVAEALYVFPVEAIGGVGQQFSLLALFEPENTTDKTVVWESSNPEVASVTDEGTVSLISLGKAEITAHSGEFTTTCQVTVDNAVSLTEMAMTGVIIDVVEDGIVVRNAAHGESIAVYTVDGKVANGAIVENDETKLKLSAGIYIVKISPSTVAKVLVH